MVKHIVLFKLTSLRNPKEKENQLEQMKEIYSVFNSASDLQNYQVIPEHLEVIKKAPAITKEKTMLEYEF